MGGWNELDKLGRMLHTEDKSDWDDRLNGRRRKINRKENI